MRRGLIAVLITAFCACGDPNQEPDNLDPAPFARAVVKDFVHEVDVERVCLSALDVDNREFDLCVWPTDLAHLESDDLYVAAGDREWRLWAADSKHARTWLDREDAELLSRLFDTPLRERANPPYALRAEFEPESPRYVVGEEVSMELVLTNVGKTSLEFHLTHHRDGTRNPRFPWIRIYRESYELSDEGRHSAGGGPMARVVLAPGESHTDRVNASRWSSFSQPGEYHVKACYELLSVTPPAPFPKGSCCEMVAEHHEHAIHVEAVVAVAERR